MTLTEAARLTKFTMVFGTIFMIVALSSWVGYKAYDNYQKAHRPPPEIKPTVEWGALPKPKIPSSDVSSSNFAYSLSTPTGDLEPDKFPKIFNVYYIVDLEATLLASERAKEMADKLGFPKGPQILTESKYKYTSDMGELTYQLDTANFKFERTATDSGDLARKDEVIADEGKIVQEFKGYLRSNDLDKDLIKDGKASVEYDKGSQAESERAYLTLFQTGIAKPKKNPEDKNEEVELVPIVSPDFKHGLINAVISKYQDIKQRYLALDYVYWPIDLEKPSTYPIKGVKQAYEELQQGKGFVIIEPTRSTEVSISKVYLAYYLPKEYTPYLQPVYVFEGENQNFVGYVPAVTDEYLTEPQADEEEEEEVEIESTPTPQPTESPSPSPSPTPNP